MHWFLDPILKHYADFEGRSTPKEFWLFTLGILVFFLSPLAVFELFKSLLSSGLIDGNAPVSAEFVVVFGLLFLAVNSGFLLSLLGIIVPLVALQVRRLHDINLSGWWCLVILIPYLGIFILIVLSLIPSKPGSNKWGPNLYKANASSNVEDITLAT